MTELYDDCNWVNKKPNPLTIIGELYQSYNESMLKIQSAISKGEMKIYLTEKDIDSNALFYPEFTPDQQTAFKKWREGLDWGTKKQTDDNRTGDLILP